MELWEVSCGSQGQANHGYMKFPGAKGTGGPVGAHYCVYDDERPWLADDGISGRLLASQSASNIEASRSRDDMTRKGKPALARSTRGLEPMIRLFGASLGRPCLSETSLGSAG